MPRTFLALLTLFALLLAGPTVALAQTTKPWLGMHVLIDGGKDMEKLRQSIEPLAKMGVNVLIIEVAYNFDFKCQPGLAGDDPITAAQARAIAEVCRQHNIRPIPEINCLGHQSWRENTLALLKKFPEFDESPSKLWNKEKNPGCKSWCTLHPDVTKVVFPMIDEVIEAFGADAFHVGFDEVFKIGDETCPRCRGKDPAELYANEVIEFHNHIVGAKKIEMLMWGDRLLDGKAMNYGNWEGSGNGTWLAADKIPKDIIVCDWHYEVMAKYPSIGYLLEKGFRVWPSGWHRVDATKTFLDAAMEHKGNNRMLGYLSTTWYKVKPDALATFEPTKIAGERLRDVK
jgi:hypothetical protein